MLGRRRSAVTFPWRIPLGSSAGFPSTDLPVRTHKNASTNETRYDLPHAITSQNPTLQDRLLPQPVSRGYRSKSAHPGRHNRLGYPGATSSSTKHFHKSKKVLPPRIGVTGPGNTAWISSGNYNTTTKRSRPQLLCSIK